MSPILNVNLTLFVFPCEKKSWALWIFNVAIIGSLDFFYFVFQIMIIYNKISLLRCEDVEYTKLYVNSWHLDELKVSWDDNICKLIHKRYHSDVENRMILNIIFSVVDYDQCP